MRRVCLIVSLICIILACSLGVAAQTEPSSPLPAQRLTEAPGDDREPQLVVDSGGRALVVWKHVAAERGSAAIELARASQWQRLTLAPLAVELVDSIKLTLAQPDDQNVGRLLWSSPATVTQHLTWSTWNTDLPVISPTLSSLLAPQTALSLLDERGHIHSAWLQDNTIHYVAEPAISATLPLTLPVIGDSLTFALDAAANPHFALLVHSETGNNQLVYVSQLTEAVRVRETTDLSDVHLLLGPTGQAHLIWREGGALYHADSSDWSAVQLLLATAPSAGLWAAAVGPDETLHLAWVADGTLWYAPAASLEGSDSGLPRSRTALLTVSTLDDLTLTVDAWNQRHLAWAAPDEQGNWDIYYLAPTSRETQLAITSPQEGATLTRDSQVEVVANVPPSNLVSVECYLQVDEAAQSDELLYLGKDYNGRDGWAVPLALDTLTAGRRYRALALSIDTQGYRTRALGGWFTVQPQGSFWAESQGVYRGQSVLEIGSDGTLTTSTPLEISLRPASGLSQNDPYTLLATMPVSSSTGLAVSFDSHLLPDGTYTVTVNSAAAGIDGTTADAAMADAAIHIANALAPEVRVTSPRVDTVLTEHVSASAEASDPDGEVVRVDFYLERNRPLLEAQPDGTAPLTMPELVWLGSDNDGSDGWSVRVPVSSRCDGDDWVVRAIAFDDQGLSASALSTGHLAVVGRSRPYLRFLSPEANQTVSGHQIVTLFVANQTLDEAALYLEGPDNTYTPLGLMTLDQTRWVYDWDTTRVADGTYTLTVIGSRNGIAVALERCTSLVVANAATLPAADGALAADGKVAALTWSFSEPQSDQVLAGYATVRLQYGSGTPQTGSLMFYYRDQAGQLRFIGQGTPEEGGWSILWDTQTVLDGAYELIAAFTPTSSNTSADEAASSAGVANAYAEMHTTVRNNRLDIVLDELDTDTPWQGLRSIAWQTQSADGSAVVDIAYSPDNGAHWLSVAEGLANQSPYAWDTSAYVDSTQAILRLTVHDGTQHAEVYSAPFTIDNVNEPPHVALLAPLADSVHSGQVRVVWQATDPDQDTLTINLDYRRNDGAWTMLAHGLANEGSYLWSLAGASSALNYELRITARDSSGATAQDTVESLFVTDDTPPTVELLWPNSNSRLTDEAVVLWKANDAEAEDLSIDLYYSDNAGQTWLPLAEELDNVGYYVWQVSSLPPGDEYRLQVVAHDSLFSASDASDQVFSIGTTTWSEASLLAPASGSTLAGLQLVRWSLSATSATRAVSLQLRRAGTEAWQTLAVDCVEAGFYLWNTRTFPDGSYELRLGVSTGSTPSTTWYTQPQSISLLNRRNHIPEVTLLSPRGGESWSGMREITWKAGDADGDVLTATLWLNLDGESEWRELATLDAGVGRYLWNTRLTPTAQQALLRISVSDGTTTVRDTTPSVLYLSNHRGQPPYAAFTSPNTKGLLSDNTIVWVAEDTDGDSLAIDLSISADGGTTWQPLAQDLPATGEYDLTGGTVSDQFEIAAGQTYRVRLQIDDGCYRVRVDSSDFVSMPSDDTLPTLRLLSPSGGESWSGTQEVRWELAAASGSQAATFDVEYSHDNGQNWYGQASGLRDVASYRWDTRTAANGVYRLRVTATLGSVSVRATSAPFTLRNAGQNLPVVSLLQPGGGEVCVGSREVRWHAQDADGDTLTIGLAYSVDEGITWKSFAYGLPNTGSYIWDTTIVPNCTRVWLRITASDEDGTTDDVCDTALAVLNPHTPLVTLLTPTAGDTVAGQQVIRWATAQEPSQWVRVNLDISLDGGVRWQSLAVSQPSMGSYTWNTSTLPENSVVLVRVIATDDLRSALSMTQQPVIVRGNATQHISSSSISQ